MWASEWRVTWIVRLAFIGAGVGFLVAYLNRPNLLGVVVMPFKDWVQLMPGEILVYILIGVVVGGVAGAWLD